MDELIRYIAIDLKSFYASVECVERGLNPLEARLVVADPSRSSGTICLAVSPALKAAAKIGGRPRLFELEAQAQGIDYIVAKPRMALYMDYSERVYHIYLRYIAPEDIHVYSVDEVFIDAGPYLRTYHATAVEIAMMLIRAVHAETGITATAGVGSNLYLSKVAMDIVAKKMAPDSNGARVAELDVRAYREKLWDHTPLTDFWGIGAGKARKLACYGMTTMGDIARFSLSHEPFLFELFGVNAEILIDHAWGVEPVTMRDIKTYVPQNHSLSKGQVLPRAYTFTEARIAVREMAETLCLDMISKHLETNHVGLYIGYDANSFDDYAGADYLGAIHIDHYGRLVPVHAHGHVRFDFHTSSQKEIAAAIEQIFDRKVNRKFLIRRIGVTAREVARRSDEPQLRYVQREFVFNQNEGQENPPDGSRERRRLRAILNIKHKYGKNAILRGLNFAEGATQCERNTQIGGHNA